MYFGRKPWSYVALSALCSILLPSEWKPNDKVKKGISSIYGMGEVFMMQEREFGLLASVKVRERET